MISCDCLVSWTIPPLIDKDDAGFFAPLIYETDAREKIKDSSFLSAMSCQGGINFTSKRPGGYRPKVDTLVTMDEKQLSSAIKSGLNFYHNEFSGLVFGVGKKSWMEHGTSKFQ